MLMSRVVFIVSVLGGFEAYLRIVIEGCTTLLF